MPTPRAPRTPAVLVSVWLPGQSEAKHEATLAEMRRLMSTLGLEVLATITQKRSALAAAAVLGEGKLAELARYTGGTGVVPSGAPPKRDKARRKRDAAKEAQEKAESEEPAGDDEAADPDEDADASDPAAETSPAPGAAKAELVVVDNEISPSQMRNLERAVDVEVLDRAGVIIEIFHRHAHTREAKLQVELARLRYEAPRLREKPSRSDRQRGGGVGGKGEDELELDRRRIRDRIAELRRELASIAKSDDVRRSRQRDHLKVALVGYTNAGKSSLMRALTGSEVLVADQLFATLGTTVRPLVPESQPRLLISDTVGFIQELPHDLVASFRSTLDEALAASLLLFVVDASDPAFREQLAVTRQVLGEIGAAEIPSRLLLNKRDRLSAAALAELQSEFPEALMVSALDPKDVRALRDHLVTFFERDMEETTVRVPYTAGSVLGEIRNLVRVVHEAYHEDGVELRLRGSKSALGRVNALLD